MGRYRSRTRSRSRSYSPPPRKLNDDHRRRRRREYRSSAPSGLLVRNIALDAKPEDLQIPFERFGPVKDVYLPKNYYTGEPRGFGFVKFRNPDDAAEAKEHMNHQIIGGREISIVFAEENRKTPQEMRSTARISDRYGGGSSRRRSPRRRRNHSYSPSRSPPRRYSRDRDRGAHDDDYYYPRRSISASPHGEGDYRPHQKSRSPRYERDYSSVQRSPRPRDERDYRSPQRSRSPHDEREYRSHQRSPSPERNGRSSSRSHSYRSHNGCLERNGRGPSRSRSYSPR